MFQIKQSEATAARRRIPILFVSSTDGFTPVTPTSPAAYISQNGATWVSTTNAVAVATLAAGQSLAGVYYLELTATEVANLGWITVNVQATNARQYNAQIQVQAYDPYDVVRLGVTALPNVATGNAGAVATGNASGQVTVATNNDKTGYSLTQAFPTNFGSMAITAGGAVTAGTVSDKTGYSLTQAFPTNFASLAITAGGAVTAGTVSDKTGYSLTVTPPTASTIATQVWSEALPGTYTSGQAGFKLNAAGSAADPWATALPGAYSAGSAGFIIGNNLNASISSRMATFTLPTNFSLFAISGTGAVTAGTVSDKTGYSLATAPPTASAIATQVWSEALPGTYTSGQAGFKLNAAGSASDPWSTSLPGAYSAGSAGYIIGNNLNSAVGSVAGSVWGVATRTLTSGANIALAKGTGITGFNDITALSVWDVLASTVSLTNSIGLQLKGNIDTTISSRLATSGYTAPPTSTTIAGAVWSENISSYNTTNTAGKVLKDLNALNPGITGNTTTNVTATTTTFSVDRNDATGTFNHQTIVFTSGLLNGVSSDIVSWTKVGSYSVVVVGDALPSAPNNNTPFYILPQHVQSIDDIVSGVWNKARATSSPSGGIPSAGTYGYYLDSRVSTAGGGGGGSSVTVRQGPFTMKSEQDTVDGVVEALVGSDVPIQIQVGDGTGTPVPLSGTATISVKTYNSAGTLVETTTGTLDYAGLGYISATFTSTTTATAGRYTVVVEVTDTTTVKYGGLQLLVKGL